MEGSTAETNTSTAIKQDKVVAKAEWIMKWEQKNICFHQQHVHRLLENYVDLLLNNRTNLRIFFPLCGKAVDMKWLADMGHSITGVDVSEIGLKDFFTEQNISYVEEQVSDIPGAKVFKSLSGNISLYCCSIYDMCRVADKFDCIWDRGALVAINPCDRERYANVLSSLMGREFRYLLVTVSYDHTKHSGPPFYVPDVEVDKLFGTFCCIKHLEKVDAFKERHQKWGLDYFYENIYLLTPKPSLN
ncbi:thiopurine S-methyltransferase-like [Microcaecilia unicolor]|uniref:thiopurine S-methyltransferase n=1 Tax=Microcaecilia unicolor TaxID=1415580 RepID=A0A6P7YVG5_9AMPH|nr:thiopurine S-methyltransferase-like [Microcaecilia unicolor]XP_030067294.1 thiopurine S-methyltransferase-like [Microcaecilia unicolor]